ncbi:MAG: outer membrane protein OmpA-like peptidoglycan-associated protein, partial [Parvicellaceae bacterium]
ADHIDPKFKYEIQVISYTDQDASVGYNQKLSERRAAGIVAFLYNDYPSNVMIKKFSGKGIHQDLSLSKAEKRSTHITIKMVPSIDN